MSATNSDGRPSKPKPRTDKDGHPIVEPPKREDDGKPVKPIPRFGRPLLSLDDVRDTVEVMRRAGLVVEEVEHRCVLPGTIRKTVMKVEIGV